MPLNILAVLPDTLRTGNQELLVFYYLQNNIAKIVKITSNDSVPYGIAIDIGTTTVALLLVDLNTKKVIASRNTYNSQIECGLDVISRINFAKKHLNELKERILKTIDKHIYPEYYIR